MSDVPGADAPAADGPPADALAWPDGPAAAPWVVTSIWSPTPADAGANDAGPEGDGASPDAADATPAPLGAATGAGPVLALRAAGRGVDITARDDEFLFAHQVLRGDGAVVARVRALEGCPRGRVTFGLMIREYLDSGSRYAMSAVIGARGVSAQTRSFTYAQTLRLDATVPLPVWLRVERRGIQFRMGHSQDGKAWTESEKVIDSIPDALYAGLVASSHDPAAPCAALFDAVRIESAPADAPDAGAAPDAAGD